MSDIEEKDLNQPNSGQAEAQEEAVSEEPKQEDGTSETAEQPEQEAPTEENNES